MATFVNPVKGPNKLGSVGMPLPDVNVRIVDSDEGTRALPAKEVGEIIVSAKQLMIGYWNQPEETANTIRDIVEQGTTTRWLYTGDLGYLDEDGYLFIVDRKKDLIKTSGYQVWPREIEEVIASHPAIAEVGVASIPDPTKGEAVKAWVVLRAGQTVNEAGAAHLLPRQTRALQGPLARGVPHRAAKDDGRKSAAAHADGKGDDATEPCRSHRPHRVVNGTATVAFVTYSGVPDLTADDRLAVDALATLGVGTDAVSWDDPNVDWQRYDAVVLRSTWDYYLRLAEFVAWIDRLEALGAPVVESAPAWCAAISTSVI